MIKNQWYGILDSKDIKGVNKIYGVLRLGEKLAIWRSKDGSLNCVYDQCCHRGASLSHGCIRNEHLACPFHGFEYNGKGKVVLIPANGKISQVPDRYHVNSYKIVEKYGIIWLWYGEVTDNLPPIPFFNELQEGFTYGGFSEIWPVHYTRAVENQLDVVHLPFVHTNSIGRGNRTLVNGPVVEWNENLMTFYVDNHTDDGKTLPKKASELTNYKSFFHLQFQMPNIWQNIISSEIRIVAIFAPIDENNTHIYLRFYQKFLNVPPFRQLVNWLSNVSNMYILHQDRRVVLTQIPKKSELKMGENLIQGDAPIIEFRKRRALLMGESDVYIHII